MKASSCLIYGAYGYTGELIARRAAARGLRPILAGRRAPALEALAAELSLPYRAFSLEDIEASTHLLEDVAAVLHCAGPFRHTARPMVEACLAAQTHYLDITGEIEVFEWIFGRDEQARSAGVVLLPGVGMDVVPSDCLAAHLAARLPDATHLELALMSRGGRLSRGTLHTMIEGLPEAGAERLGAELVARPLAFEAREIDFADGPRWAMTIPWGDLSTAYHTTGIPHIRVYLATPRRRIRRLRRLAPALSLFGSRPARALLHWLTERRPPGPTPAQRHSARTSFWGAVRNDQGETCKALVDAPEGYSLTAMTAVRCLQGVLGGEVEAGAHTPGGAFGADFIKDFAGVSTSW